MDKEEEDGGGGGGGGRGEEKVEDKSRDSTYHFSTRHTQKNFTSQLYMYNQRDVFAFIHFSQIETE